MNTTVQELKEASVEYEVKITTQDPEKLFFTLSFNGEIGVGRQRLRWVDGGNLLEALAQDTRDKDIDTYCCLELLGFLADYGKTFVTDEEKKKDRDSLKKRLIRAEANARRRSERSQRPRRNQERRHGKD